VSPNAPARAEYSKGRAYPGADERRAASAVEPLSRRSKLDCRELRLADIA
jgi:hypothetical protein